MTLDKLIQLGIAAKVTNEIFTYHVTGLFINVTYHSNFKRFIFSSAITGQIYKEETIDYLIDFEDFVGAVRLFAKEMYDNGHAAPMFNALNYN